MKTLLTIMTGPQGSGNHLFSKALGQNPNIWVWPKLQNKYWEGHDMEPFAEYWKQPALLSNFDWTQSSYYVTSISCPYFVDGVETIPVYHEFVKHASEYADIQFLIIGRDPTILEYQQHRVRGKHTTPTFIEQLSDIILYYNSIFASQELLYLYGLPYLQQLEKELGLMSNELTISDARLKEILKTDANRKYINDVDSNWLDDIIKLASSAKGTV
jgi:hypothetical protein